MCPVPDLDSQIAAVRGFNRFYTRKLGIIEPEAAAQPMVAAGGADHLRDRAPRRPAPPPIWYARWASMPATSAGSFQKLQRRQIVSRKPLKADRRATEITLTAKGRAAFAELDGRSRDEVGNCSTRLDEADRAAVVNAMATIEQALEPRGAAAGRLSCCATIAPAISAGCIARHGAIYAQEYGWDISFEALVAEIAAEFLKIVRSCARAMLDCRGRRRTGWQRISGQGVGRRRQTSPAAGGESKARGLGRRARAGRRMHPLRTASRLQFDHAMDPKHSGRRTRDLSARRIPAASEKRNTTASASILSARRGSAIFHARRRDLCRRALGLRPAQMLVQPRHDLDEIAGPRAVIELGARMPSQPSRQAPGDPGRQKM